MTVKCFPSYASAQKIRPGGERKNPRSCERKSAGADKLVRYLEQAKYGRPRLDRRDERTEDQSKYALMDVGEKRKLLFTKLEELQKEKEALMELYDDSESERRRKAKRRELKGDVVNLEIIETVQAIDDLESESDVDKYSH